MRKRDPEKSKNYRYQQYRSAWEKESWAQEWLSRSNLDPNKAFCNVCIKELVPGKSELQCHSKSAVHTRRIKAEQRIFACKTEYPSLDVMHKGKEGYVVISNVHPHQELYRFKPELTSEFASQAQHNGSEGMEVSGSADNQVNDILAETQAVSDIGFTEDMWDDSLQHVDTAIAGEGLASLSRNDAHQIHSNQPSSTQQTQIVIITPSSTASSSDDIFPSTALARSQSFIVTRSEAVSRNRKPVSSSTRMDNFTNTSSSSSYRPNYSCVSSQPQTSTTPSLDELKLKTSGKCNDCCSKCKIHDSHWREYLTEKIKFKKLEQQRVREELKTQRLIQQYHRLKLKRLLREDDSSIIIE